MKKQSEDATPLFRINRRELLKVFNSHNPSKDNKLPTHEFFNITGNLHLCPSLISKKDLKKLMKNKGCTKPIDFKQFQTLLKSLARRSFPSDLTLSEKFAMLLTHAKTYFETSYDARVTTDVPKPLSPRRCKGESVGKTSENGGYTDRTRRSSKHTSKSTSLASSSLLNTERPLLHTAAAKLCPTKALHSPACSLKRVAGTPQHTLAESENYGRPRKAKVPSLEPFLSKIRDKKTSQLSKRSDGTSPNGPVKSSTPHRQEAISKTFLKFREQHAAIATAQPCVAGAWDQVRRREEYICSLRNTLFDRQFVKAAIFRSWRAYVERTRLR